MKHFAGRVALVTGGGAGIGRSIAHAFAREGMDLVIADIDLAAATAVAVEVEALGRRALPAQVDVADLESVTALAGEVTKAFPAIDILVNNAGVTLRPLRYFWDSSYADLKWVMDINFWGVVNGLHVFLPGMRDAGGPKHIVNTSSLASFLDVPGHSIYSASKGAVDGLSRSLRAELAEHDIGVTLLFPGYFATQIYESEKRRPAEERSEAREVAAYSGHHHGRSTRPIDIDLVGPMVVEAIMENRPYCFTHPLPPPAMEQRFADIRAGYRAPAS